MTKVLGQATGFISFSQKGPKGDNGDTPTVVSTKVQYALSASASQPSSWNDTMPNVSDASNKGKFLWTKTTYTWSTGITTQNITCAYIGKDGENGSSVSIKGSLASTSNLPTSGAKLGDGYIIGGNLWVYTGTTISDATHTRGFENVGQIKGDPGTSADQYYVHIAWMKDNKGTGFTVSNPNGAEYAYVGILVDKNSKDSTTWSDYKWSCVKGAQGDKGTSVKSTEVTYQIGSSPTTPPTGTWHTEIQNITDANPYLWTRTVFIYDNNTRSDPSYSVSTRGTKGAIIRQHNGFESGSYKYLSGVGAEEYQDMVLVGGKWYRCTSTYTSSSPSVTDPNWVIADNYIAIATQILLAQNATITMASSQQINLLDSNSKLFGSFRHVSNNTDIALWLGSATASSAPFYVRKDGYAKMTNASVTGWVSASGGNIGGFTIGSKALGADGGMYLTDEALHFGKESGITANNGYYLTFGVRMESQGMEILSVTGTNSKVSTGARINVIANTTPSDPVSGGKMCTALDLNSAWASGAGSFDLTDPYEGNHAIVIRGGDVIGLRPSFVNLTSSKTLTEFNYFVDCSNTSAITLTFPYSPKIGQHFTVLQRGGRINFSGNGKYIHSIRDGKIGTTWNSDTTGQLNMFFYDGSKWVVYWFLS